MYTRKQRAKSLLLLSALCADVTGAGVPAGVAAYACKDNEVLHLLARDDGDGRRERWGHIGGKADGDEPPEQTAEREFFEESNCVYPKAFNITTLGLQGPGTVAEGSRTGFRTYVVRVPYVAPEVIAAKRTCFNVERSEWIWVDQHALMEALRSGHSEPSVAVKIGKPAVVQLWGGAARSLIAASREFPLASACSATR